MASRYRIWCRVSGGMTGTREAWLKHNGKIYEVATKVTAQKKAKQLNKDMGKNTMVNFHYSVVEV